MNDLTSSNRSKILSSLTTLAGVAARDKVFFEFIKTLLSNVIHIKKWRKDGNNNIIVTHTEIPNESNNSEHFGFFINLDDHQINEHSHNITLKHRDYMCKDGAKFFHPDYLATILKDISTPYENSKFSEAMSFSPNIQVVFTELVNSLKKGKRINKAFIKLLENNTEE